MIQTGKREIMNVKKSDRKAVYHRTSKFIKQLNVSQPANYKTIPPLRSGIAANDLFSLFTAEIIQQDVIFIR